MRRFSSFVVDVLLVFLVGLSTSGYYPSSGFVLESSPAGTSTFPNKNAVAAQSLFPSVASPSSSSLCLNPTARGAGSVAAPNEDVSFDTKTSCAVGGRLYRQAKTKRTCLAVRKNVDDGNKQRADDDDMYFNLGTTFSLVGGQSALVLVAVVIATIVGTPNYGLGSDVDFSTKFLQDGTIMTIPLGILAVFLDCLEESVPALQEVTKATQRSVLTLLGGKFKPVTGLMTAAALGIAAGVGEELLFRGVLQYELTNQFGELVAITAASIIFGLLHAVTPVYAILSSLASVYFGYLFIWSGNLAVPITTHAVYDIVALIYAHWTVSQLSDDGQAELSEWEPAGSV